MGASARDNDLSEGNKNPIASSDISSISIVISCAGLNNLKKKTPGRFSSLNIGAPFSFVFPWQQCITLSLLNSAHLELQCRGDDKSLGKNG